MSEKSDVRARRRRELKTSYVRGRLMCVGDQSCEGKTREMRERPVV